MSGRGPQPPVEHGREISGCGAQRGFGATAGFYELLSRLYSGGLIERAKCLQLKWISPESRVLYLGVGAGEDALLAARSGASLTCIDISASMLGQLNRKLVSKGLKAELICGDALQHDRFHHYDVVICNFFLNCFPESECLGMLSHASSLLRREGILLIADVAKPQGSLPGRALAYCYVKSGMFFYWMLGMVRLHGIYDYRSFLRQSGLELLECIPHRLAVIGPVVYENLVARKTE